MSVPGEDEGNVPYREFTDAELAEKLRNKGVESTTDDGYLVLDWTCPHCEHPCHRRTPLTGRFVGLVSRRLKARRKPRSVTEVLRCDCQRPHEDRPPDGRGCGFWSRITLTVRQG